MTPPERRSTIEFWPHRLQSCAVSVVAIGANQIALPNERGAVEMYATQHVGAQILDDRGNLVRATEISGVPLLPAEVYRSAFDYIMAQDAGRFVGIRPGGWFSKMTELDPGETLRFTLNFGKVRDAENGADAPTFGRVFKVQVELITALKTAGGAKPKPKLENIFFDNISASAPENRPSDAK